MTNIQTPVTEQIVTPVIYESVSKAVWNAHGGLVCKVDEHDANFDTDESIGKEQWDKLCDEVGERIAYALNRTADLEAIRTAAAALVEAVEQHECETREFALSVAKYGCDKDAMAKAQQLKGYDTELAALKTALETPKGKEME